MAGRWSRGIVIAAIAVLAVGCDQASETLPPSAPAATPASVPASSPQPSAAPVLEIDGLPTTRVDHRVTTAVCDPGPDSPYADPSVPEIGCGDGLRLAMRAIRTVTQDDVIRLYVRQPGCATTACTDDELAQSTVTGWTRDAAWTVALDSRLDTIGAPVADPSASWPAVGASAAPSVKRPAMANAPAEVQGRDALPFCGRTEMGQPASVQTCFRDAVLAGRPAEIIEKVYSTEGDPATWLTRYLGSGAVVRYSRYHGQWVLRRGALDLGYAPEGWSFDPLTESKAVS